jgi:hypothetical protein
MSYKEDIKQLVSDKKFGFEIHKEMRIKGISYDQVEKELLNYSIPSSQLFFYICKFKRIQNYLEKNKREKKTKERKLTLYYRIINELKRLSLKDPKFNSYLSLKYKNPPVDYTIIDKVSSIYTEYLKKRQYDS